MYKKRQADETATPGRRWEPIRWSIGQAAAEFGCDHRSLTRKLTQASVEPGDDGRYSTAQILAVIHGDREKEELRRITEDADRLAIDNRKARGELIDAKLVFHHFDGIFVAIRQLILSSGLPQELQDKLLGEAKRLSIDYAGNKRIAGSDGAAGDDTESATED